MNHERSLRFGFVITKYLLIHFLLRVCLRFADGTLSKTFNKIIVNEVKSLMERLQFNDAVIIF